MNDDDKTTTTPGEVLTTGNWPQLTEDQKAELRTAAPQLVAASRSASEHVAKLAKLGVRGEWLALALSTASSLSTLASGVALFGATAAWLACGDGETDTKKPWPAPPGDPRVNAILAVARKMYPGKPCHVQISVPGGVVHAHLIVDEVVMATRDAGPGAKSREVAESIATQALLESITEEAAAAWRAAQAPTPKGE